MMVKAGIAVRIAAEKKYLAAQGNSKTSGLSDRPMATFSGLLPNSSSAFVLASLIVIERSITFRSRSDSMRSA